MDGLQENRPYWYRFRAGDVPSPIGRTRTLPSAGAAVDRLRFAFASCQHLEFGYFTAYEHLAAEDLDLVFHLGDYIYEGSRRPDPEIPRQHVDPEAVTLEQYRTRYAQYHLDPALQAAHAACPWMVTWDDHEVENNYAASISSRDVPVDQFLSRRAAAYQAYYEHMPLRRDRRCRAARTRGCTAAFPTGRWARSSSSTPASTAPISRAATGSARRVTGRSTRPRR